MAFNLINIIISNLSVDFILIVIKNILGFNSYINHFVKSLINNNLDKTFRLEKVI